MQVVVSGGEAGGVSLMTSIEVFNGTDWINSDDLIQPRLNHGAVSIPAGRLVCL